MYVFIYLSTESVVIARYDDETRVTFACVGLRACLFVAPRSTRSMVLLHRLHTHFSVPIVVKYHRILCLFVVYTLAQVFAVHQQTLFGFEWTGMNYIAQMLIGDCLTRELVQPIPVDLSDVVFALWGFVITSLTIAQCFYYESGDQIPAKWSVVVTVCLW